AMGGVPAGALLSIALPSERAGEWLDTFVEGFLECARRHHTALVGGDTNRAAQVVIDVSVLGFLEGRAVPRGGAQVGDWILVTGALGGSRAGLEALMRGEVEGVDLTPHFRPQPRLQVGALARAQGATAMMDLSDGLAADLPKLLRASGVGAVVYAHRLPVHPVALQWATAHGSDPALFALAGGEDYELLITAPPSTAQRMLDEIPNATGVALTPIGAVTAERTLWLEYPDGVRVEFPAEGWDHFRG
ncbi:MAG: thiamine-phosphate kinase, partial [Fimbriimonadales bacterium]|nr:thiamine-phosphate kinase [Fimbriimonadales bacterium]